MGEGKVVQSAKNLVENLVDKRAMSWADTWGSKKEGQMVVSLGMKKVAKKADL